MVEPCENVSSACNEFFKVYLPQFSSLQLVIPPAFISNFDRFLPEKASLKDPTTRLWPVDLERNDEHGVLITKGWQDFARYHSLELGDFLLFNYDGNSNFNVKIFGKNGCKKDLHNATNRPMKEEHDIEHVCEQNGGDIRLKKVQKSDGLQGVNQCAGVRKFEELDRRREPAYVKPRNPHFVKKITKATQYRVYVPATILTSYGIELKTEINLCDHNNKKWPVRVVFSDKGRVELSLGWVSFRRHHKLEKNNRCVFEFLLDKRKECRELRVQIIRGEIATEVKQRCRVIGPGII